ncbi:MAG: hypothetical protein Tsb0021_10150 [Chlamydiales bacterium]
MSIRGKDPDNKNISIATRIKLAEIGVFMLIPVVNSLVLKIFERNLTSFGSSLKLSSFANTGDYSQTEQKITPTRKEFITAIQNFKRINNVKLKKLFEPRNRDYDRVLRGVFWNDPIISNYFSRKFENVDFTSHHPDFRVNRDEKAENDYYEWRIYELAEIYRKDFLPYRKHSLSDNFYNEGPVPIACKIEYLMSQGFETNDIRITRGDDIYGIREMLIRFQFDGNNTCRFVVSPNYKDEHATTLVSILERGSDRILTSIMINSWNKEEYSNSMGYRYNLKGSYPNKISDEHSSIPFSSELYQNIKEVACENVYIDDKNKRGYVIDQDPTAELEQYLENGTIEVLHHLYTDNNRLVHIVKDNRKVPFLDASHHIQTAKNDGNCVLYTNHMLQAVSTFLSHNENADKVYALALKVNDGSEEEKADAAEKLSTCFREDIKQHLPFYYNEDGSAKNEEELQKFHLRRRWEVGSMAASSPEYLKMVGFLPEDWRALS